LENSEDDVGIKRAWETVRENIKISAKGSPGYSRFLPSKHIDFFLLLDNKSIEDK
jgi:hypothetical protein